MATVIDGYTYPSGEDRHTITLSDDEMLVLDAFFESLQKNELKFSHPAQWVALQNLAGQFERTLWQILSADYERLLSEASTRLARGSEFDLPGLGSVRVDDAGKIVPLG